MASLSHYNNIVPYTTKDGSKIRELMHPSTHANSNQSLAEATMAPGMRTHLHKHLHTEEIYHILVGQGLMTLGEEQFAISTGDTVCISPGTVHCMENTGTEPLRFLCSCSPPYSHNDTILIDT